MKRCLKILKWILFMGFLTFTVCFPVRAQVLTKNEQPHSADTSDFEMKEGVIQKYKGNDAIVKVPEGVTGIAAFAFSKNKTIESISLPDGVAEIDDWAFSGCSNLKKIDLPESLTKIGYCAFASCTSLQEIIVPKKVTTLGRSVFENCVALENINVQSDCMLGAHMFEGTRWLEEQKAKGSSVLYKGILLYIKNTEGNVAIPANTIRIGEGVFENANLTAVTIPKGVTEIGGRAFLGCKKLKSVTLDEDLEIIGEEVFTDCINLSDITIPKGVSDIGFYAFARCKSLKSITMNQGLEVIEESAFTSCTKLTEITIPSSVYTIKDPCFCRMYLPGKNKAILWPAKAWYLHL